MLAAFLLVFLHFGQGVENAESVCRKIACYTPASKSIKTSTGAFPFTTCGDKKVRDITYAHSYTYLDRKFFTKSHTNNKDGDSCIFYVWLILSDFYYFFDG